MFTGEEQTATVLDYLTEPEPTTHVRTPSISPCIPSIFPDRSFDIAESFGYASGGDDRFDPWTSLAKEVMWQLRNLEAKVDDMRAHFDPLDSLETVSSLEERVYDLEGRFGLLQATESAHAAGIQAHVSNLKGDIETLGIAVSLQSSGNLDLVDAHPQDCLALAAADAVRAELRNNAAAKGNEGQLRKLQ